MGKWLFLFLIPLSAFAFEVEIRSVRTPDTLVLSTGATVKLAGIVPPAQPLRYQALMDLLSRKLVNQSVEIRPDSFSLKSEKPSGKASGKKSAKKPVKAGTVLGYVFVVCDTCGLSSVAPEFKGSLMVTTHEAVLLNSWLIERGWATADTALSYEKKNYYRFLESQTKKPSP